MESQLITFSFRASSACNQESLFPQTFSLGNEDGAGRATEEAFYARFIAQEIDFFHRYKWRKSRKWFYLFLVVSGQSRNGVVYHFCWHKTAVFFNTSSKRAFKNAFRGIKHASFFFTSGRPTDPIPSHFSPDYGRRFLPDFFSSFAAPFNSEMGNFRHPSNRSR